MLNSVACSEPCSLDEVEIIHNGGLGNATVIPAEYRPVDVAVDLQT